MVPKREPMVSTFRPSSAVSTVAPATAISSAGQFGRTRRISRMAAIENTESATVTGLMVPIAPHKAFSFGTVSAGSLASLQSEQVARLRDQNDDGDACGEAHRHRIGDVLYIGAEPQKPDDEQQPSRHQGREHEAVIAVALHGHRDQPDKGRGRTADLEAAAAQQRDQEAADDGGIKPALGAQAGADRDRHRQWQRHDGNRQSGQGVGAQAVQPITLAQDGDQLRGEQVGKSRFAAVARRHSRVHRISSVSLDF